jgi:hypothetical protein
MISTQKVETLTDATDGIRHNHRNVSITRRAPIDDLLSIVRTGSANTPNDVPEVYVLLTNRNGRKTVVCESSHTCNTASCNATVAQGRHLHRYIRTRSISVQSGFGQANIEAEIGRFANR